MYRALLPCVSPEILQVLLTQSVSPTHCLLTESLSSRPTWVINPVILLRWLQYCHTDLSSWRLLTEGSWLILSQLCGKETNMTGTLWGATLTILFCLGNYNFILKKRKLQPMHQNAGLLFLSLCFCVIIKTDLENIFLKFWHGPPACDG